jgi:hypothetical protein
LNLNWYFYPLGTEYLPGLSRRCSDREQSVPIFQRLAGDHPAGRDDVRAIPLSPRNVEDLLAERGIDISHETVRLWWDRFGPMLPPRSERSGSRT